MTDYADARMMMVDTQVRPSDVTKFPIIDALLTVQRESYVPSSRRDVAYADDTLSLGEGRYILDARSFAKLLDAIDVQPNELVLDLGCGLGYSSAVLARLAEAVVAVEHVPEMVRDAEDTLSAQGFDNVAVLEGNLHMGAAQHAPYDVILIEGGIVALPDEIAAQLKNGGRIAAIFMDGALGEARIGYKSGETLTWRRAFNAAAPVLPGFEAAQSFAL
ncbi:MAG: protein-L-isoaspartate O-methyltransferase [Pseudomonadota bacterium]